MKMKEPHFNPKFHQYEITWKDPDGSYGGVWGGTKEECLKNFNETNKKKDEFQQGLQKHDAC